MNDGIIFNGGSYDTYVYYVTQEGTYYLGIIFADEGETWVAFPGMPTLAAQAPITIEAGNPDSWFQNMPTYELIAVD